TTTGSTGTSRNTSHPFLPRVEAPARNTSSAHRASKPRTAGGAHVTQAVGSGGDEAVDPEVEQGVQPAGRIHPPSVHLQVCGMCIGDHGRGRDVDEPETFGDLQAVDAAEAGS